MLLCSVEYFYTKKSLKSTVGFYQKYMDNKITFLFLSNVCHFLNRCWAVYCHSALSLNPATHNGHAVFFPLSLHTPILLTLLFLILPSVFTMPVNNDQYTLVTWSSLFPLFLSAAPIYVFYVNDKNTFPSLLMPPFPHLIKHDSKLSCSCVYIKTKNTVAVKLTITPNILMHNKSSVTSNRANNILLYSIF